MTQGAYNSPYPTETSLLANRYTTAGKYVDDESQLDLASVGLTSQSFELDQESILIPNAIRANWYSISRSGLPERVFNELLMAASSHERMSGDRTKPLASESLRAFLRLWQIVKEHSAEPVLNISPTGEVISEWFRDANNSLIIMLKTNGNIFYSLFDRGAPCEGIAFADQAENMVAMFLARDPSPFRWSDADEGE